MAVPQPTIAVKESRTDLLEVGPSTGLRGGNYKLIYVIGKGVYRWRTGDQSSNVPGSNDADNWVAPSEDTSGKSGAWQIDDSGILDPEHATDSGTDAFVSATNTGTPGTGAVIVRDFQSANTTSTPTLDGKTIKTRDGSALWAGALDGPHRLEYDGTDYLLLDPLPIDEDDMSSDSATAVPTQQSVKAYALTGPGTSSDPSLAFDTWRTPNTDRTTLVIVEWFARTNGSANALIRLEVDESGGTTADYNPVIGWADTGLGSNGDMRGTNKFIIPAGGSYRIVNSSDPTGINAIEDHREFTL